MKKWYSIALFGLLISCTSTVDKEKLELEKVIASQGTIIDSLQNILASAEMSDSESEEQENFLLFL